jgi:hypothetical protein
LVALLRLPLVPVQLVLLLRLVPPLLAVLPLRFLAHLRVLHRSLEVPPKHWPVRLLVQVSALVSVPPKLLLATSQVLNVKPAKPLAPSLAQLLVVLA